MTLDRHFRTVLSILAGLVLVSVAVIAVQGGTEAPVPENSGAAVVAADETETGCTGDCATCTHAESEPCPPHASDDGQTAASVDAARCIGCVRCVNVAPEAFRMNPETRKAEVIADAPAESIARGAQACPVDAITQ